METLYVFCQTIVSSRSGCDAKNQGCAFSPDPHVRTKTPKDPYTDIGSTFRRFFTRLRIAERRAIEICTFYRNSSRFVFLKGFKYIVSLIGGYVYDPIEKRRRWVQMFSRRISTTVFRTSVSVRRLANHGRTTGKYGVAMNGAGEFTGTRSNGIVGGLISNFQKPSTGSAKF